MLPHTQIIHRSTSLPNMKPPPFKPAKEVPSGAWRSSNPPKKKQPNAVQYVTRNPSALCNRSILMEGEPIVYSRGQSATRCEIGRLISIASCTTKATPLAVSRTPMTGASAASTVRFRRRESA